MFAFHAGDDAVDDGVAFELGEHAEHLHEHAAHRGGGVEWFGRGPEHDPGGVEFVEQHHHVPQVAGEPVHSVHEQHVDQPGAGGGERALQSVAFGAGAGGVVGEPCDEPPAGLGVDVSVQARVLCLDRVGLVLVVGGAPHVDPHSNVVAECGHRGFLGALRGRGSRHCPTP